MGLSFMEEGSLLREGRGLWKKPWLSGYLAVALMCFGGSIACNIVLTTSLI